MIVVLMGVSGSGKTAIGTLLAKRMSLAFADADDFHSPANKAKMAAGHPLNDADREPWLQTLHGLIQAWFTDGKDGVLACSALKESYRTTLAGDTPDGAVRFVVLEVSKEIIAARMKERHHEFMNPALLDSQIATLEAPKDAVKVNNDRTPDEAVNEIVQALQ